MKSASCSEMSYSLHCHKGRVISGLKMLVSLVLMFVLLAILILSSLAQLLPFLDVF